MFIYMEQKFHWFCLSAFLIKMQSITKIHILPANRYKLIVNNTVLTRKNDL